MQLKIDFKIKQIIIAGALLVSVTTFAQKDELKALKKIYKRKTYLSKPQVIVSDSGSEFKGTFDAELLRMGIKHHKIVKVGRSRAVSLVERKNQTISYHSLSICINRDIFP